MHWQNLIKCALLGTERHPPDGQTLAALEKLGIKTTGEPATLMAHAAADGSFRQSEFIGVGMLAHLLHLSHRKAFEAELGEHVAYFCRRAGLYQCIV